MAGRELILLALIVQLTLAQPPPHGHGIDLEGCGIHKGCMTIPPGCHKGQQGAEACDGIYVQEVMHNNPSNIHIQLFARNVAGWVAVGFNTVPHMSGTDVLACQADEEGRVVIKNLHNVNHTNAMDKNGEVAPYIYAAEGRLQNGSISCQFVRPLVTPREDYDLNLNMEHYIIFAWNYNQTAPATGPLMHMHQAPPIVSNATYTAHSVFLNNETGGEFDLSGCGKTKGCSRAPAGCSSAEECYYLFTQQVNAHNKDMVDIEVSGLVSGWVAVGYNSNYTMNGTDVVGCQMTPERERVAVKKLHNVNHTNLMDHNGTNDLPHAAAHFANDRIYCRFTRPIKPIPHDPFSRDLSQKGYIILAGNYNATAPANEALGHMHSYMPLVLHDMASATDTSFNYNATAEKLDMPLNVRHHQEDEFKDSNNIQEPHTIDLSGCGKTKGCSRAPAGCQSADECVYVFTQQSDESTMMVTYEISGMFAGWVALGVNFNYSMNGADVHGCQLTPDSEKVVVKKVHNFNFTNVLDSESNVAMGLANTSGSFLNNRISCTFTRPIKPIEGDSYSRDLSQKATFILAGNVNGTAPANKSLTYKHNGYEPLALPDQLTALNNTFNYNATSEEPASRRHVHPRFRKPTEVV